MDLHGILVVDKPRGMSSHDVVNRVRRLLKTRKVGHAGTLDPAAEGILVIALGRATKLLTALSTSTKSYAAHIVLGVSSVTGDIEGPVEIPDEPVAAPSADEVSRALERFVGEIAQRPPAHSAIKVGGQPLYRRARQGEQIDVPTRTITIRELNLLDYSYPDLYVEVTCSAGTYVRSLARDVGQALGTAGYLHYLLRTTSGGLGLRDAWSMDDLERSLRPETFAQFALHPALPAREAVALLLGSDAYKAWYDGRPVTARLYDQPTSLVHAFQADGAWIGMADHDPVRDVYLPRIVVHE